MKRALSIVAGLVARVSPPLPPRARQYDECVHHWPGAIWCKRGWQVPYKENSIMARLINAGRTDVHPDGCQGCQDFKVEVLPS